MSADATGSEPILLREPTTEEVTGSRVEAFRRQVNERTGRSLGDFEELWQWSVSELEEFWEQLWSFLDLGPRSGPVLTGEMPNAQWFTDQRLNFADQVLRRAPRDQGALSHEAALVGVDERGDNRSISWAELHDQVRRGAGALQALGVGPGDVVAGYLPNIPEAMVACLATAAVGAIWSGVGQDYQASAVLDRFATLRPKVLITADGYCWNGSVHPRAEQVARITEGLPSITAVICIDHTHAERMPHSVSWQDFLESAEPVDPVELDFGHPLWVLFSSGTTGLPKGLVQSHGGITIELSKLIALHLDSGAGDRLFWWTSPSWIMWNISLCGLLGGLSVVCYDGAPAHPDPARIWEVTAAHGVTQLGVAPGFLDLCMKSGLELDRFDLTHLRAINCTGSPLAPRTHGWLTEQTGLPVRSVSGGTDVCTGFAGGVASKPVWAGELSCRLLGVAMQAWNSDGNPVIDEVGELVVTRPMPSMPIRFWDDPEGTRYRAAYFDTYPGVWRHGDWITVTSRGSVVVHGRSDSTLNRGGVRIGSADISRVVEAMDGVQQALVIGAEMPEGGYWMPMFVVLDEGIELDDALVSRMKQRVREEASPRHVPDEVFAVPGLPATRTGKRLEVPLKRILQGHDAQQVLQRSALADDSLIEPFIELARTRHGRH